MATESANNQGLAAPNKLPAMTTEEVKARAQRIAELRGKIPTDGDLVGKPMSVDEAKVVAEFVFYWAPFIIVPEKQS